MTTITAKEAHKPAQRLCCCDNRALYAAVVRHYSSGLLAKSRLAEVRRGEGADVDADTVAQEDRETA